MLGIPLRLRAWAAPILGALIGLCAFALSVGLPLVHPSRIEWLLRGDTRIHFLGWHAFRHEPWNWPLGATNSFGYPVGASVGNTDSIPLFALLFKILHPVLGEPHYFQYFGLWLMTSFVLQGVFAVLLLRTITSRLALLTLGAALFVMTPVLFSRWGHPALTAHWLIVASLWLYFRWRRPTEWGGAFYAWAALAIVAAATHPYLAMMVLVVAAAFYARAMIILPGERIRAALQILVLPGLVVVVLWQSGYFVVNAASDLQVSGFGFHSMNLLAPVMPVGRSTFVGTGPFSHATAGQYEGDVYLGAGMLLLAGIALFRVGTFALRGRLRGMTLEHVPLLLGCIFLTLLALSHQITIGSRTVLEYDPAWWGPFTVFRASGRMFWPVNYLLVFGILAVCIRRFGYPFAVGLLLVGALLQAVDNSGLSRDVRGLRTQTWEDPLGSDFWKIVPPRYAHLTLIPTNICPGGHEVDWVPFALLAGRVGLTINGGEAARYDVAKLARYCQSQTERLRRGVVSDDELYVLQRKLVPDFVAAVQTPLACTAIDGHGVCVTAATYLAWQDEFDITRTVLPPPKDFLAFYEVLNLEYRDRLQRPLRDTYGSEEQRVESLVRYVAYRVTGCTHDEAQEKVFRQSRGARELRVCTEYRGTTREFPPANETFAFRTALETVNREIHQAPVVGTHVDLEGEAVWMQEYARFRLAGCSDWGARASVLAKIRGHSAPECAN